MNKDFKYIPKDKRKKIMLIADDIRVHSGVATVAKEIVLKTCQHFNWVNVAGAIKHPEKGKRLDLSKDTADLSGVEDASVMIYPVDGYGDPLCTRISGVDNTEDLEGLFLHMKGVWHYSDNGIDWEPITEAFLEKVA